MKILLNLREQTDHLDRFHRALVSALRGEEAQLRLQSEAADACCDGFLTNTAALGDGLRLAVSEAARLITDAIEAYEQGLDEEVGQLRQSLTHTFGARAAAIQAIGLRAEAGTPPPLPPSPEEEAEAASAREMAARLAPAERSAA